MRTAKSIGVLFILIVAVSCGKNQTNSYGNLPQEYPVLTLIPQNTTIHTTYPVTLRGEQDIEIRPRIEGYISEMYIDEGAVVKKGQSLFKIDSPDTEQQVVIAQSRVNTAMLDVERLRPLADKGIISSVQIQTYINTCASVQAELEQAKTALGWTNVTSPVNGVMGTIPFRQGSLVNNTSVLTTVANIGYVYAYFSLNEKELNRFLSFAEGKTQAEKIKNMPEITLMLADGTCYTKTGRIETITGLIDVSTGSANLRVKYHNPDYMLRSGTSGNISIPRKVENALLIPQKATFTQQDKVMVYTVVGDSVVQKSITVIPSDSQNYLITDGIAAGDRIVGDGIATVRNGMKIKPLDPNPN